jgi:arabinogalactan endo-1,4-beta-galactosidase
MSSQEKPPDCSKHSGVRRLPRRAGFAIGVSVALIAVIAASVQMTSNAPTATLRVRGADMSFTLQEEAIGSKLTDNGQVAPIENIVANHGANYSRIRLWVNPQAGTSDLKAALTLARRAKSAGLRIMLNLHYSDSWADRTTQQTPEKWQGQNAQQLANTVKKYTRDVIARFGAQGTPADVLQVGNEVTHGMLWPVGQVYPVGGEDWSGFTQLLKAGIAGAKEGNPQAPPAIMIHTDTGGDTEESAYFFDQIKANGVPFDLIGLSYYPFWHGSLDALGSNLKSLASKFGKDIILAETAYPWTLSSGDDCPSVVTDIDALPDAAKFPPTPLGQADFFEALNLVLREVPGGHGAGYIIWEPGWLPGVNATPEVCNGHSNLTLFNWSGHGLPALTAFEPTGKSGR